RTPASCCTSLMAGPRARPPTSRSRPGSSCRCVSSSTRSSPSTPASRWRRWPPTRSVITGCSPTRPKNGRAPGRERVEGAVDGIRDFHVTGVQTCALPISHARVMLHQPHGGAQGQATDIEIQARLIVQMREQLNQILAEHTGQPVEKVATDTERDYWMLADEAKEYGVVDGILTRRELAAVASN